MIMKMRLIAISLFIVLIAFKSDKEAYKIFNSKGKIVNYQNLLKSAEQADIILFGELHNNPLSHWLQLELSNDLYTLKKDNLVLGAEMFEADNQLLLNEYLKDVIANRNFENEIKLWNNYETDYKPLVEMAKENKLDFIATNIPRRYAAIVSKKGFEGLDSLDKNAYQYIAPLPVIYDPELKCYKGMLAMMGEMGGNHMNENFPKAQAIKDATMAHFILKNWSTGKVFIHFNGTYHSNDYEGIYWYLKQMNPNLNIITIASIEQEETEKLDEESQNIADFIICIPSNMTKTY
jgi:uncharacterized iron-regulated protein